MRGRTPTKQEKEWMNKSGEYGCVICKWHLEIESPCSLHHINGRTKPGAHLLTIGLCGNHHQIKDNEKPPRWVSRHGDSRYQFEEAYGTEMDLLKRLINDLQYLQ